VLAITKVVRDIDEGWVFDPSFNLPVRNDRMTIDPTRRANASEAMYLLIYLMTSQKCFATPPKFISISLGLYYKQKIFRHVR